MQRFSKMWLLVIWPALMSCVKNSFCSIPIYAI